MARRPIATGAAAERARLLAAERHGAPWRRWAPILDDGGPGSLPGISGVVDETSGLRVSVSLASLARHADAATIQSIVATPTASYLESTVRTAPTAGDHQDLEIALRCAKRAPEDIVIRIAVTNQGPRPTMADLTTRLESLDDQWVDHGAGRLAIRAVWETPRGGLPSDRRLLSAHHADLGTWWLAANADPAGVETVEEGTSAAFRWCLLLEPGETRTLPLRLSRGDGPKPPVGVDAEATLGTRAREAAAFQKSLLADVGNAPMRPSEDAARNATDGTGIGAALARLLWQPRPAQATVVEQVFAALGLAVADPVAAQRRLSSVIDLRLRGPGASTEPPVAAWAALRIHELHASSTGRRDHDTLERVFHPLLEDYSLWVDRLDPTDRNPLQGGLLGLDGNGSTAAGAAWMACYSVWMLSLAVELARDDRTYQDVAVTLLDTTLAMVTALDKMGGSGIGMWDEADGWYHDVARADDGAVARVAGQSPIGLVPLLAVAVIPREALDRLPDVAVRLGWSLRHERDLAGSVVREPRDHGTRGDMLVSLVPADRRDRALAGLDRALAGPDGGRPDLPIATTCLLLDVLDRLRVFGGGDHRDVANLRSVLMTRLDSDAPIWANVLAVAMRRALRD